MTDVAVTVDHGDWVLSSDTTAPEGDQPAMGSGRNLVEPFTVSWAIADVLPPVAVPATVQFSWYDDMQTPGGALPCDIGDPIGVYVSLDFLTAVVPFQGRVTDVSAVPFSGGGMIFTVIAADRLADLGSTPGIALGNSQLSTWYNDIAADAEIDFDYDAGATSTSRLIGGSAGELWHNDGTSMTMLDLLNRLVSMDIRYDSTDTPALSLFDGPDAELAVAAYIHPRYLSFYVDVGLSTPIDAPEYRLTEYPRWKDADLDSLAGALELAWSGALWILEPNPDYYDPVEARTGIVLDAGNVSRDVGEWRKTRQAAINTAEIQHVNADESDITVRRKHDDLVAAYGRITRSIEIWTQLVTGLEGELAYLLIGPRSQVQTGYGIGSVTIAWETLTDDAMTAFGNGLWPMWQDPVYGRPVAIVNVPSDWSLAEGHAVVGRLMGVSFSIAADKVRTSLTLRGTPASVNAGVTYTEVGTIGTAAGHTITFANLDPTITFNDLALVD